MFKPGDYVVITLSSIFVGCRGVVQYTDPKPLHGYCIGVILDRHKTATLFRPRDIKLDVESMLVELVNTDEH